MLITVVIPTLNEEKDLPRTLESLSFANEVLIIDSGSTDKTLEIAKKNNCVVIHHAFKDFAQTRNFGDQHARNDWILSIDADVVVPQKLINEIKSLKEESAVYKVGRINKIWGKSILYADWAPLDDCHIRLYHRSLGSWSSRVHEQFVSSQKPKVLKNYLVHYNYETITEFITKLNSYSDIVSSKTPKQTNQFWFLKMIYQAKYDFLKRYFYKLGFFDGYHGLFLSYLQALYYLSVGIKKRTQ